MQHVLLLRVNSMPPALRTASPAPLLRALTEPPVPQLLLSWKLISRKRHLESTLQEVLIPRNLKPFGINSFKKTGEGVPVMVNQLLEESILSQKVPGKSAPSFTI